MIKLIPYNEGSYKTQPTFDSTWKVVNNPTVFQSDGSQIECEGDFEEVQVLVPMQKFPLEKLGEKGLQLMIWELNLPSPRVIQLSDSVMKYPVPSEYQAAQEHLAVKLLDFSLNAQTAVPDQAEVFWKNYSFLDLGVRLPPSSSSTIAGRTRPKYSRLIDKRRDTILLEFERPWYKEYGPLVLHAPPFVEKLNFQGVENIGVAFKTSRYPFPADSHQSRCEAIIQMICPNFPNLKHLVLVCGENFTFPPNTNSVRKLVDINTEIVKAPFYKERSCFNSRGFYQGIKKTHIEPQDKVKLAQFVKEAMDYKKCFHEAVESSPNSTPYLRGLKVSVAAAAWLIGTEEFELAQQFDLKWLLPKEQEFSGVAYFGMFPSVQPVQRKPETKLSLVDLKVFADCDANGNMKA